MTARIFLAAGLSAIAMFLWGFVFWGPVLNATARIMKPLPAAVELDVIAPLRANNTPDGMYVYPGPPAKGGDAEAAAQWDAKIKEGPIIHMAYRQQGVSPMDPVMFAKGLAHSFVVALLASALLAVVAGGLPSYGGRVAVLTLTSLIAAVWTNVSDVIWWFHTPAYCLGQVVYTLGSGLLMALITAAIVRPAPAKPAA